MSDEVDYSQFYYRPPQKTGPVRPPTHPTEEEYCEDEKVYPDKKEGKKRPTRKKGKMFKKTLFVLFVATLCFALLFFCADFFGKGFLTDAVKKFLSGTTYEYYYVVRSASSRNIAYACSLEVRQGGGGGYILGGDGYYVAYAVYTDKSVALTVQAKNKTSEIVEVRYSSKDELAVRIDSLVQDIESGIDRWERGILTEAEISSVLRAGKEEFDAFGVGDTTEKTELVRFISEGLGNFSLSATEKITQLSELRYFLCCIVYSSQAVFK